MFAAFFISKPDESIVIWKIFIEMKKHLLLMEINIQKIIHSVPVFKSLFIILQIN